MSWSKVRVEQNIYKRTNSDTKEVAFFVEIRTKRGNAKATFDTVSKARKYRSKVLEEMRQNRFFGDLPGSKVSVSDALDAYREAKGVTKESDITRYGRLQFWADAFRDLPVLELNGTRVAERLDELATERSGATCNRYATVLSAAWKWWSRAPRSWVRYEANPVREAERMADSPNREVTLTREERAALMEACEGELKAAVIIAMSTGIRHGELARLTWADVAMGNGSATAILRDTKNGETRPVAFEGMAYEALRSLPRGIGSKPVFSLAIRDRGRLRHAWKAATKTAGLPELRWHDMRHVAAQLQIEGGSTLMEVALHLGHKSFAATRRYSSLDVKHRAALAKRVQL